MPQNDNSILYYELREPQFSLNSAGTQITAKLPLYAKRDTASPAARPSLDSGAYWYMAQSHVGMWPVNGTAYDTRDSMWELVNFWPVTNPVTQTAYSAGWEPLTSIVWGYAVVAESTITARRAAGRGDLWQSDFSQFATLPLRTLTVNPTIASDSVSFSFAMPSEPSQLWLGYKLPGANSANQYWKDPTAWYCPGVEGPAVNGVPVAPGVFGATSEGWLFYGDMKTWYVPSVSLSSAPAAAKSGMTTTLTITAPSGVRTLTAADLTVTGGTLSNFTQVS